MLSLLEELEPNCDGLFGPLRPVGRSSPSGSRRSLRFLCLRNGADILSIGGCSRACCKSILVQLNFPGTQVGLVSEK